VKGVMGKQSDGDGVRWEERTGCDGRQSDGGQLGCNGG
jgi:hypothetical protein